MFIKFDNSMFATMANQGYDPGFIVFLMGVPVILGVILGLYLSYVKKRSMDKVGNIYCLSIAINTSWVALFLGFSYIIVVISGILLFYLGKVYLITLRKFMSIIHTDKSNEKRQ